ncbi:ABC-F family ATP-binding cassette domain-containing protein [Solitalea sp. MAHUQ-68]|uniref:ABC-F family ATP-binding cassette domain-containing protein n=1 Tax=Solitalea agri TaxID=2953739 RepID=A0A9X2EZV4_9SPHI|nr:ABC-F family ATP-binding cassette domain-containing protein [Solitalea agri]MCO4291500.1 ABC-F family ATP-binding cassette domain-containing protein [Solitalea agri]
MIALNDITFEFGARALYDEASWHIKPGEKIGLIGANGTGKTTLLKLLVGDYKPTSGTLSKSKDLKIGYLNQDLLSVHSDFSILHVAMEAFERQNQLHDEIEILLKKLENDYSDDLLHKLSDKQHEFENLDGYNIQYKAEQILAGLGFSAEDSVRPLKEFSGGWRMRVMLAKILLQQPDLLLLDEPTNHMDLPSIKWLENYLTSFEGAYIIVSHDRYFLDRTVQKIVESKGGQLIQYAGNYSFYLEEKALREEIQRGQFKNQQQKIKEEERLIERFRAKASKAKMAQSRIKALDKMERVSDVDDDNPSVSFRFSFSRPSGRSVVQLRNISKAYPGLELLKNTDGDIEKGDKIALIGANGKGKSTLLRLVAGTDKAEGEINRGHNVFQSFFAQHQLESLHLENTILEELQAFAPTRTDTELRSLLGCFLFTGDDVFKKIKVLSGGEKSRVALAKTLTSDANFLILDEPTNHLDIQSVNILIQALQQYEGTFILVSHDRYLIENVANKIWFIENKEIKEYPGIYHEYEEWQDKRLKEQSKAPQEPKKQVEQPKVEKQDNRSESKERSKELKKLNQELERLENLVSDLENQKKNFEAEMAKEEVFSDSKKLNEVNASYEKVKAQLSSAQNEWEVMAEKIMELEA